MLIFYVVIPLRETELARDTTIYLLQNLGQQRGWGVHCGSVSVETKFDSIREITSQKHPRIESFENVHQK